MADYVLIMAGGSGTRLWPLSRENRPKQSLRLVGGRTMYQHAVDRVTPSFPPERVYVVTRADQATDLQAQTPEIPQGNFIIEPEGRGTAPAIGLGAIHLRKRDANACMIVLTADHFVRDVETFRCVLAAAVSMADQRYLVTLGIQPSNPSTGYGYIQQGESLGEIGGYPVFRVSRFTEKPNLETALQMVTSGNYSWNSGMFVWRVEYILAEFERQMPAFYPQLIEIDAALETPAYYATLARIWPQVAKETIDYGVMEGAERVAVLPVNIGWTDIGAWSSLSEVIPSDSEGNIFVGSHVEIDTQNTLTFSEKRLIATVGVQDLIIIDSEDAVLVCPKERDQDVRNIVMKLKEGGGKQWL